MDEEDVEVLADQGELLTTEQALIGNTATKLAIKVPNAAIDDLSNNSPEKLRRM